MAIAESDLRDRRQDLTPARPTNGRSRYLRAVFRDLGAATGAGAALAGFRSHTARIAEKACEITGSWRREVRQAKDRSQVTATLSAITKFRLRVTRSIMVSRARLRQM